MKKTVNVLKVQYYYTSRKKDRPLRVPRALFKSWCTVRQEWPNISVSTIS